jgi:Fe-S cluster biogenesis protein NfuA
MQQVEALVRKMEGLPDPEARASAVELVQALMEFHGAGLERMMEIVAESGAGASVLFDRFAGDGLVGSLLLIYGLHPLTLEERVARALERVRPLLDSHGGSVELVGIDEGVVRLRLQGSCKSCPSSSVTLKLAIEEAIYESAPDVAGIEAEGAPEQTPQPTAFVQIGARQNDGHAPPSGSGV